MAGAWPLGFAMTHYSRHARLGGFAPAANAAASVSAQVRDVVGQAFVADDRPAILAYAGILLATVLGAWCLVVGARNRTGIDSGGSDK
jgi:hypothetical protein